MKVEDIEELLNTRIIEAFSRGFSVVEITRALRKTTATSVYNLLRDTGRIKFMARSEYRRQYDIDPRLATACLQKGISFGRRCLSWRLDPHMAVADLKSAPDSEEESAAHVALKRDFPDIYLRLYNGAKIKSEKRGKYRSKPASVMIEWSSERKAFLATVPECPGIEASGKNWDDVFSAIKSVHLMHEHVKRIDWLLSRSADEFCPDSGVK